MKEFFASTSGKIIVGAGALLLVIGLVLLATAGAGASDSVRGIGLEKSIAIALEDAGLSREQASELEAHFDKDDGPDAYEVSFRSGNYEYDYTIKASDGSILECRIETLKNGKQQVQENPVQAPADSVQQPAEDPVQTPAAPAQEPAADSSPQQNSDSDYIGADKAKSIALQDADVSADEARFTTAKLDRDDGRYVYEVDFYTADAEYDYEIDALSGKILERDSEPLDDLEDGWDD